MLDFVKFVGEVATQTSETIQYSLGFLMTDEQTWSQFLLSLGVEIWLAPLVGVFAVIAAAANLKKMQAQIDAANVQIDAAHKEARINHLISTATRKDDRLRYFFDERLAPRPEVIEAIAIYYDQLGIWKHGLDANFRVDTAEKVVLIFPKSDPEPDGDVQLVQFNSHIVNLNILLHADREKTVADYAKSDNDLYGLREWVFSFAATWVHLLRLVLKAVDLGYSKEAAGLMLSEWQHSAEVHNAVGAISDEDLELARQLISEASELLTDEE